MTMLKHRGVPGRLAGTICSSSSGARVPKGVTPTRGRASASATGRAGRPARPTADSSRALVEPFRRASRSSGAASTPARHRAWLFGRRGAVPAEATFELESYAALSARRSSAGAARAFSSCSRRWTRRVPDPATDRLTRSARCPEPDAAARDFRPGDPAGYEHVRSTDRRRSARGRFCRTRAIAPMPPEARRGMPRGADRGVRRQPPFESRRARRRPLGLAVRARGDSGGRRLRPSRVTRRCCGSILTRPRVPDLRRETESPNDRTRHVAPAADRTSARRLFRRRLRPRRPPGDVAATLPRTRSETIAPGAEGLYPGDPLAGPDLDPSDDPL